jgi:hypothetical protein
MAGDGRLWFSLLSAPAAWGLDQGISYALVKPVCFANATFALTGISGAALALVVAGVLVGRGCLQRAASGNDDGGRRVDRSHFLAMIGIGFNLLVALLIVVATIPHFILSPCE